MENNLHERLNAAFFKKCTKLLYQTNLLDTNDLNSDETAKNMDNTIIDLARFLKNDQNDVIISNIILRTDNANLN